MTIRRLPDDLLARIKAVAAEAVAGCGRVPRSPYGEALVERVLPTEGLWRAALGLALRHDHAVYDAVFIAAAEQLGTRLLTFDRALLAAFPDRTLDARG